jgi:hypothetical protein
MKSKLFQKSAALAIGSIFAFSGAAFASTNHEIILGNRLSNSNVLVTQRRGREPRGRQSQAPLKEDPVFSRALASAETALGNAAAAAQSEAIGGPKKSALAESLAQASSLIGNAAALSSSTAVSDQKAVANSLSQAETVLGDALAIAQSDAISGPGKPAISQALSSAKTSVGNATAIAQSRARSGE